MNIRLAADGRTAVVYGARAPMIHIVRLLAASLLCCAATGTGAAVAAEPIMPLDQVHKGMRCQAASVISGTEITTFDIEILDVVAGDSAARTPRILFRASGPAVDATGIGPGFSGSPISCPDEAGTMRVAGAISEGIGDYGNKVALATPIELMLGEPVDPPAETRTAPALVRSARPLATPLSVGGLSAPVAEALRLAARRSGVAVYAAPPAPTDTTFAVQTLRGGSAMAVGLATGDVSAGAIGTVTYVDGDRLWAFGHPLDAAGRRSLFLQDAYVYTVINNPIGAPDLSTYKLAAPGHALGTLTNDTTSAVVGRLGVLPASIPLTIHGTDLDTGRITVTRSQLADESALGPPTGSSAATQVGALAVSEVATDLLQGVPTRQSGSMCVRIGVQGLPQPMRFCNRYFGGGFGPGGAAAAGDFAAATSQIDAYNFGPVHITGIEVDLKLRRSLRQAYMLRLQAPARVRRGRTVTVKVLAQRVNGPQLTRAIRVRVPKYTPLGRRQLRLTGSFPEGSGSLADALSTVFGYADGQSSGDGDGDGGTGPRTLKALAGNVEALAHFDGVTASLLPAAGAAGAAATGEDGSQEAPSGSAKGPEAIATRERPVFTDPELLLSGQVHRIVRVTK